MHEILAVKISERRERLDADGDHGHGLERMPQFRDRIAEIDPVHIFENEMGIAVAADEKIEDLGDVFVLELLPSLRLGRETLLERLIPSKRRLHRLDDSNLAEEPMADLVERTHTSTHRGP